MTEAEASSETASSATNCLVELFSRTKLLRIRGRTSPHTRAANSKNCRPENSSIDATKPITGAKNQILKRMFKLGSVQNPESKEHTHRKNLAASKTRREKRTGAGGEPNLVTAGNL
eukprot:3087949-Pyramimonas_sp.AAC.1